MQINIHSQGLDVEPAIERFVVSRVNSALERYEARIRSVDVFLRDINGPKGGLDKTVVISVRLDGHLPITVTAVRDSLESAITVAAQLARRRAKRCVRKQQQFERLTVRNSQFAMER